MENYCSVGYDSVLRCSVWEYRDGYRDEIFLMVHGYRMLNIWLYISVWDGGGVVGEKHAYFVLNVRCSG